MRITYQPETDSFYFYLKEGGSVERTEEVAPETNLDFDAQGNLIGVEVYGDAARRIDLEGVVVERHADKTGEGALLKFGTEFLTQARRAVS